MNKVVLSCKIVSPRLLLSRLLLSRLAHPAVSMLCFSSLIAPSWSYAGGLAGDIEEILVTSSSAETIVANNTESASVGTVLAQQIEHRPLLRPAEILETVPGMVVTQHSGGGKANQYFLRGFNLDHSTDFANYFEGAPINMVSHGHGQGYTDLSFLIPEMLDRMVYKKGPYYASEGDFSSAGSARFSYVREKQHNQIKLTAGEDNYQRLLFTGGINKQDHHLVYAIARTQDDGPWVNPESLERDNVFLKYTHGDDTKGYSVSGMYFDSSWVGTDQIPQRLVADGTLDRFATLDPTTGGDTQRHQLSVEYWSEYGNDAQFTANAYLVNYELALFSNFTYYASDINNVSPLSGVDARDINDQVIQLDDRTIYGGEIEWQMPVLNDMHTYHIGSQIRIDDIDDVGVGQSFQRQAYHFNDRAAVTEQSYALHQSLHSEWHDQFASIVGLRYQYADISVDNKLSNVFGQEHNEDAWLPSVSLRIGPFKHNKIFLNYGQGFHSNDARGAVLGQVPLLSKSEGFELGFQNNAIANLQLSLVVFQLDLDSELVFVGDDGTTEPKDASRRRGIELSAYYQPTSWLVIDADYTKSHARFKQTQFDGLTPLGDHIPDSIADVFSMGVSAEMESQVFGGLRMRYFGPRDLTEDGRIRSDASFMVNANMGYQWQTGLSVGLEVINLTNRDDNDITYWYASRTQLERDNNLPAVDDFHSHPMVPRTFRLTLGYQF